MAVGIYDMTPEAYRAAEGVSKSTLFELENGTEASFEHFLIHGKKETEAMRFGTMIHCYILEPNLFNKRYVLAPAVNKNTNAYKAFKESLGDKLALDPDDDLAAKEILSSIKRNSLASAVLDGHHEKSFFWRDTDTNVLCKCRPDSIHLNAGIISDLKTSGDISPDEFIKKIYDMGYHVQAAMYLDGVTQAIKQSGNNEYKTKFDKFVFVAVEDKAPYQVALYDIPEYFIDEGRRTYKRLLKKYQEYGLRKKNGLKARSYPESIITLEPRAFMFKKEEK